MKTKILFFVMQLCILFTIPFYAQRQVEKLDRGLVAMKVSSGVFISWRVLAEEYTTTAYNLYRNGVKITSVSSTGATNFTDVAGTTNSTYYVKAVVDGVEQVSSPTINVWANIYKEIPLTRPSKGTKGGSYEPGDCSTGDLNGDGKYEIIVRWQPSNALDPANDGYTDPTIFDAYTLEGTLLWRIKLGINVRSNSHYNPFIVYDLDGDGIAEMACKTAPGTMDGTGSFLSNGPAATDNDAADYRSSVGRILSGPEYLTIFNGKTGKEMQTITYEPGRGTVTEWGDSYGNRCDRYLACVAYLNGKTPSLVMCRGYYAKTVLVAYNWNGKALSKLWNFTADASKNSTYMGQGCHSVSAGDVDNDGFDEIIYGSCCIDHDGTGKYSTRLGHGDALHVSDLDPDRPGLEVWQPHEDATNNGQVGASFRDANTGEIIFKYTATGDIGRGLCGNITTAYKGVQCWTWVNHILYTCKGAVIDSTASPSKSPAFICWWDGNIQREMLSGTTCDNYNTGRVMTFYNYATATHVNGTKSTPCLQADILGDWREEVIYRSSDSTKLIIFSTTYPTTTRLFTLMHDKMYRLGVAWQNVAYNQPPWPSFYIGTGMTAPTTPSTIYPQSINFDTLSTVNLGDADIELKATATSGLTVSYTSSNTNVATIDSGKLHVVGTGSCIITASQAGNSMYMPAQNVSQALTVNLKSSVSTIKNNSFSIYPNPVNGDKLNLHLDSGWSSVLKLLITDNSGRTLISENISSNSHFQIDVSILPAGNYICNVLSDITMKAIPFIKL